MASLLVFGGTTEGREVAAFLDKLSISYFYSTKTPVKFTGKAKHIVGDMNASAIKRFCNREKITTIINASHPFAKILDENIIQNTSGIRLIRFERKHIKRVATPLVKYTPDFSAMIAFLERLKPSLTLALTGVQTINKLKSYWEKYPTYFRILDRLYSIEFAKKHGFPTAQILFGTPQKLADEIVLFQKIKPDVILTKESGYNGNLHIKIVAATACKIPIFILEKPPISDRYEKVSDSEMLYQCLNGRTS